MVNTSKVFILQSFITLDRHTYISRRESLCLCVWLTDSMMPFLDLSQLNSPEYCIENFGIYTDSNSRSFGCNTFHFNDTKVPSATCLCFLCSFWFFVVVFFFYKRFWQVLVSYDKSVILILLLLLFIVINKRKDTL